MGPTSPNKPQLGFPRNQNPFPSGNPKSLAQTSSKESPKETESNVYYKIVAMVKRHGAALFLLQQCSSSGLWESPTSAIPISGLPNHALSRLPHPSGNQPSHSQTPCCWRTGTRGPLPSYPKVMWCHSQGQWQWAFFKAAPPTPYKTNAGGLGFPSKPPFLSPSVPEIGQPGADLFECSLGQVPRRHWEEHLTLLHLPYFSHSWQ